jgi:selenide, water dikinase
MSDPNLITGIERAEDAGVYKLTAEVAIVQTVDFFTPIVDDPYVFGQIAVTNALSDVYAKGGKPLTAMNIVCFPINKMDITVLNKVLKGGLSKMREAGVVLLGGHSVDDPEIKYGISVTGIIHPNKVVKNNGAKPGDILILTKPLGVGIVTTAIKRGLASEALTRKVVRQMAGLNKAASEAMLSVGVSGCTDITGFGFLGHAGEMLEETDNGMIIYSSQVPFIKEARDLAEKGIIPGGLARNREFRRKMVKFDKAVPQYLQDILFDPQTSGGLLIAVSSTKAVRLLNVLSENGVKQAKIVGKVVDSPKHKIMGK